MYQTVGRGGWSSTFSINFSYDFSAPLKWCPGHVPPFALPLTDCPLHFDPWKVDWFTLSLIWTLIKMIIVLSLCNFIIRDSCRRLGMAWTNIPFLLACSLWFICIILWLEILYNTLFHYDRVFPLLIKRSAGEFTINFNLVLLRGLPYYICNGWTPETLKHNKNLLRNILLIIYL